MANVIARIGRPALVFAPNKTLAAQLYAEFREFFPKNAVEYFVSYYDYYQPEAYVPQRDLFIEKDSAINEHIEQMRLSATKSLLERRDVVIVASVSAIYGIGEPAGLPPDGDDAARARQARPARRDRAADPHAVPAQRDRLLARHLPRARRHDRRLPGRALRARDPHRAVRRRDRVAAAVRPADRPDPAEDSALHGLPEQPLRDAARAGGERDRDDQGGAARARRPSSSAMGKLVEAQRIEQRTRFDLEMLQEIGHCKGIENYTRHLSGASAGRAAVDAGRLHARRCADVPRREPRA